MLKKAIRDEYLQLRMKLAEETWQDAAMRMLEQFKSLSFTRVNYLLSYYPLTDRKEFNISRCEELMRSRFQEVKIGWPRIEQDMLTMETYQVEPDGLYAKNKFNILEPLNGEWIPPELIDMAFVPLVAVDKRGYRVGYGKGFYDRYLRRCRPDLISIGFSFFDPIAQIKDIHDFDVPLTICITPSRIYEF